MVIVSPSLCSPCLCGEPSLAIDYEKPSNENLPRRIHGSRQNDHWPRTGVAPRSAVLRHRRSRGGGREDVGQGHLRDARRAVLPKAGTRPVAHDAVPRVGGHRDRRRDVHVRREHAVHPVGGTVRLPFGRVRAPARAELYASRIKYYKAADVTIEIREEETPGEIVERLLLELPKGVLESAKRARRFA